MSKNSQILIPGFWRICSADAYLFKLCFIFLPLLLLVLLYDIAAGIPPEDYMLPLLFSAVLLGVILIRWSAIAGAFKDHEVTACRIDGISPGTGLFGLQVFVSFFVTCGADNAERGCFLVKFNRRVKKFRNGDLVHVLWNKKNFFVIKEAYLDD